MTIPILYPEMKAALAANADSITFTREEVKKHEATVERLRLDVWELKRHIAHIESLLQKPGGECKDAFEQWSGFEISEDMDIQTEVAWENWQIAWNSAISRAIAIIDAI